MVKLPAPVNPVDTNAPLPTWYSIALIVAPLVTTDDTVASSAPSAAATLTDAVAATTNVVNDAIDPVVVPLAFVATIRK